MASEARRAFDANLYDITTLVDFFEVAEELDKEYPEDSHREAGEVMLRSSIVLLITYWESYIEDISTEAIELIVEHVDDPAKLPKDLKKAILRELENDRNELAAWNLAGEGWRSLLVERLPQLREGRNRSFNTPKSQQTKDFLSSAIGISDITRAWEFDGESPAENAKRLNSLVELRGQIAHRGKLPKKLTKARVRDETDFIRKLVSKTGGSINTAVKKVAGVPLWNKDD